jgi:hypothetical protein
MKKILLFQLLFCVTVLSAQYTQTRVLHVKSENVTQFEEAVAKKTKMFNGPQSEDRFLTFKILSGPNANQYMRVRFEANLSGFDSIDKKGYNYWKQNVMPFYVEGRVAFWSKIPSMSYNMKDGGWGPLKAISFVAVNRLKIGDFRTFRTRLSKAYEKVGRDYNLSVLRCVSGGDYAQLFQIRRNFMSFEHQENSGKDRIKVREAYNSLYGENSFQGDYEKYSKSLIMTHRRHHELMPELSSGTASN